MRWRPARTGHARPRALAGLAAGAALTLTVTSGCSTALGRQAASGQQLNYIQGLGTWSWIAPAKRVAPVVMSGKVADGSSVDVAAWRGDVVVLNVWFAGCGPCRAEAPVLAKEAADAGPTVHFLGINTDDSASVVEAFQRRYGVPYPSILDADSGAAVLALRGSLPPSSTPSTIILDDRGRPAARIVGRADPSILSWLIQDVQAGTLTPRPSASATETATEPASASASVTAAATATATAEAS